MICVQIGVGRDAAHDKGRRSTLNTRLMQPGRGACYHGRALSVVGLAKAMGRTMAEHAKEAAACVGGARPQETGTMQANEPGVASPGSVAPTREREQRVAFLAWMRENAPDVWRLSDEVDLSLVLWMRSLSPAGRIACIENFNRFIEVARAAPRSR